jgi:hypothetical protein
MLEIIFDSAPIEIECDVPNNGITIDTFVPQPKSVQNATANANANANENNNAHKNTNSIHLKYDREPSNTIVNKLYQAEKLFLNRLMKQKNVPQNQNKKCWIKSLDGKNIFHNFTKDKIINHRNFANQLNLSFNDNLKIDYNNQDINIDQLKKLFDHKISKLKLNIMLYANIYSTNDNINVNIKLKIKEIKVLELTEYIEHVFNVNQNVVKPHYEYIKRYQTSKKKVVGNIMQLFKETKLE